MSEPMTDLAGLLLLVGLTGWVARDAARRGRSWLGWSAAVFFTGALGMVAWLLVRRRSPVTVEHLGLGRGALLSLVGLLFLAFIFPILLCTTTFLFQVARVQGQSMAPTLNDGDRVIVNKWAYRTSEPRVGDIVMFYFPLKPERSFVQRVVATEGDQVRIVDGQVYRNTIRMHESFVPADYRSHDNWGPQVIPEGYVFVMGDHRNTSSDSRHWGFVPKRYVVGRIARLGL
jgi:signal peptidase I